jgi:uncharacterized membrane protein YpjA
MVLKLLIKNGPYLVIYGLSNVCTFKYTLWSVSIQYILLELEEGCYFAEGLLSFSSSFFSLIHNTYYLITGPGAHTHSVWMVYTA